MEEVPEIIVSNNWTFVHANHFTFETKWPDCVRYIMLVDQMYYWTVAMKNMN